MLIAVFIAAYTLWTQQQIPKNVPQKLISAVPVETSSRPLPTPLVTPIPNLGMPEIVPAVLTAATTIPQPTNAPSSSPATSPSNQINAPTMKPSSSPTTIPTATISATLAASSSPAASPTVAPSSTPTPTPTVTPKPIVKPLSQSELDGLFAKYADEYKVDKEQLKRIAKCESGFNTNAKNLYYGGLFQFSEASWKGYRKQMGKNTNPELRYDPEAAINTAAYLISTGRAGAWPNCK